MENENKTRIRGIKTGLILLSLGLIVFVLNIPFISYYFGNILIITGILLFALSILYYVFSNKNEDPIVRFGLILIVGLLISFELIIIT